LKEGNEGDNVETQNFASFWRMVGVGWRMDEEKMGNGG
jgi:hypothetical protein